MPKVISNTTPIISLLKIGQLNLLQRIYGTILIPEAVFREVEAGKTKPFYVDLSKLNWVVIRKIKNRKALFTLEKLDAGEAEVIQLALETDAELVIIDELLGRQFAKRNALKVTGTLGILVKAKEYGFISNVSTLLQELQDQGIWIGEKLEASILKKANEN